MVRSRFLPLYVIIFVFYIQDINAQSIIQKDNIKSKISKKQTVQYKKSDQKRLENGKKVQTKNINLKKTNPVSVNPSVKSKNYLKLTPKKPKEKKPLKGLKYGKKSGLTKDKRKDE